MKQNLKEFNLNAKEVGANLQNVDKITINEDASVMISETIQISIEISTDY